MKYFMVQSDIRDRDYEYQHLYIVSSETDLPDEATAHLTSWNYGTEFDPDDDHNDFQWDCERLVRDSVRCEIKPEHIDVLRNYLPMIDWQFVNRDKEES